MVQNIAIVTWQGEYGAKFHLALRKITYQNGLTIYAKWQRPLIESLQITMTAAEPVLGSESGRQNASQSMGNYTAKLYVAQPWNYEISLYKISATGNVNESMSVFLDTPDITVFGKWTVTITW